MASFMNVKFAFGCLFVSLFLLNFLNKIRAENEPVVILNGKGKININDSQIQLWLANPGGAYRQKQISLTDAAIGVPHLNDTENEFNVIWEDGTKLKIKSEIKHNLNIFEIRFEVAHTSAKVVSCNAIEDNNWYGGGETFHQGWPIQTYDLIDSPFLPNGVNGGVLDRYFISSFSTSTFHNDTLPLFVYIIANDSICVQGSFDPPYRNTDGRPLTLNEFEVLGDSILDVYKYALNSYFTRPAGIPSEYVIRNPIWSTWAMYKTEIYQSTVLDFSQQIDDHGFPVSQIEIDDNWETCYGNEAFDPVKFPDPAGMVNTLKQKGHNVTLWVHPFVNMDCSLFEEGNASNYFVTTNGTDETGITHWWDGIRAGIIDITKTEAAEWWYERLDGLRQNVGITAFKFDAGESKWLPRDAYLNSSEELQPGVYSTQYARFANRFGGQVEARVGYRSQDVSIFIRMLDRDSTWGLDNGLHSVITSTLHMGLVGSPFVLPDYIGGNAYGLEYPDRELFIRWVELTAFLPVMQFSITPWSYDDEVVQISQQMISLHQSIADVIIDAANEAVRFGYPIIRPLWWIAPLDQQAQITNDEFLVGDTFLVAPIIVKGATERDIYLPNGVWTDELRGGSFLGPIMLTNYTVALNEIAYFRQPISSSINLISQPTTLCSVLIISAVYQFIF